ncbi:MAG: MlaD family protein [Dokdonella sp.]
METRAHHVLIGVFTLLVLTAALGFVLWLAKTSSEGEYAYFDIVFNEAVTGLSKGGQVQYNGIGVGEVSRIWLAPEDPRKVIARIKVNGNTPVKVDTEAKLGIAGVTGVAFIQLSGGTPNSPLLEPQPDEEFAVIVAQPSALAALLSSGEDIVTSVNESLLRVGQLLSEENVKHVSAMLENVDALIGTVAGRRDEIGDAIGQLTSVAGDLKETLSKLNTLAGSANGLVRTDARDLLVTLQQAVDALNRAAENADGLIAENRGAVNTFANQSLRQIGPTLGELRETLESVQKLADELGRSNSLLLGNQKPKEFRPK